MLIELPNISKQPKGTLILEKWLILETSRKYLIVVMITSFENLYILGKKVINLSRIEEKSLLCPKLNNVSYYVRNSTLSSWIIVHIEVGSCIRKWSFVPEILWASIFLIIMAIPSHHS